MSVVTEIKSALLVLVVLHLAAFVIMVGYRTHTKQYYISEAANAHKLAQQQQQATKVNETTTTIHNPLEEFEAPVQLLSERLEQAQKSIDAKVEEISRKMDQLSGLEREVQQFLVSKITDNEDDEEVSEEDVQSLLSHWKHFVKVASLQEIPDQELKELFGHAINDIRTIMDDGNSRNKILARRFLFLEKLGAKIPKEPRTLQCPLTAGLTIDSHDDDDVDPVIIPSRRNDAAYESDLEAYLEKFEKKFGNRIQANGVQALLPKSLQSAEQVLAERFDHALDVIDEFADDLEDLVLDKNGVMKTSSSSCNIDTELVTAMVSAGLNAQAARADVQEALRRSVLEFGHSVDDLILDADLGGASTCGSSPKTKSINLRSTIDTPLLIKSIDWIDLLVDTVGGYNDGLDQYLDSLTGFYGTTSVGEILVEGILGQAGKVGDIHVDQYVEQAKDTIQAITGKRL